MLVPELDVTALAASVRFYVEVLEFQVLFERPNERFAYLERDGVELMIQEAEGPGRRFRTASLEPPYGRGVNIQLRVDDVDAGATPSRKVTLPSVDFRLHDRRRMQPWDDDHNSPRAEVNRPGFRRDFRALIYAAGLASSWSR